MSHSNSPVLQATWLAMMSLAFASSVMAQPAPTTPASAPIRGELITRPKPPQSQPPAAVTGATPPAATTNSSSAPTGAKTAAATVKAGEECPSVGFDILSWFDLDLPDKPVLTAKPGAPDEFDKQLPAEVKSLDRKRMYIRGYMMPMTMADGKTTEFIITKDPMQCCYSVAPKISDWITVKTQGKGFDVNMDEPVTIQGTLHVGTTRDSTGYVTGIYRFDGENFLGNREIQDETKKKQ